ncbi:response regulator [Archangium lansingense]|uniref:Response regulator n=1 Tax=Archangium lansingense TaxID=2995310 RepID=A0ABT4AE93_9BACT|nr:response regulator [Archangium lansinium]MCY1079641.1 response regulator [Archangium lansinium]
MPKLKVTIVDDDRDTRELLSFALESEGYEVNAAANGLRLISSLQLKRPDIILMDVNMSWIDGFELCKAVKKNEQFRDIPIIFISGRGDPDDRRRGREAGAADYFVKPLDLNALIKRLRELISPPAAEVP